MAIMVYIKGVHLGWGGGGSPIKNEGIRRS